jgi:hypothetical protein
MIRRLRLTWPDRRPFAGRGDRPIRFLAASDEPDPALDHEVNRTALGPVDGVIGCGDLEPHWLSFLADAFQAPLVYVRGNHDRGGGWEERRGNVPLPLGAGDLTRLAGIEVAGLEWPGVRLRGNARRDGLAWWHVLAIARRALVSRLLGRSEPVLVISHAPPAGAGDVATDAYHLGFGAYRWLMDRLRPPLWLHGHTTTASVKSLEAVVGPTTLVNVTGAILVELVPPADGTA